MHNVHSLCTLIDKAFGPTDVIAQWLQRRWEGLPPCGFLLGSAQVRIPLLLSFGHL
uniref:Uncharacterized protein n=1 Tax=Helianthus annuus TaxID=4232 RepID=A0A251TX19_HELAN